MLWQISGDCHGQHAAVQGAEVNITYLLAYKYSCENVHTYRCIDTRMQPMQPEECCFGEWGARSTRTQMLRLRRKYKELHVHIQIYTLVEMLKREEIELTIRYVENNQLTFSDFLQTHRHCFCFDLIFGFEIKNMFCNPFDIEKLIKKNLKLFCMQIKSKQIYEYTLTGFK